MGLRDLLKKKDDGALPAAEDQTTELEPPSFTIVRSDTHTHEILQPPDHPEEQSSQGEEKPRHSLSIFPSRRSRDRGSVSSKSASPGSPTKMQEGRRLSQRLGLRRQPSSSESVPKNLPDIIPDADPSDKDAAELQWEKRATILAEQNEIARGRPTTPTGTSTGGGWGEAARRSPAPGGTITPQAVDEDIQEAIRLHEAGDYAEATRLFGKLANPEGANNPLSQVLYGLALRHGWGCETDPVNAVKYLSAAASNSAAVEQLALQAGMKKGGAAKGELVLAIFELANCFRHGWGIEKDAYAAKQYYETAANLGDTDAMNEVAWCYSEGYGCKKDRYTAAQYYRKAENAGSKTLGNSWIWKDKYNPPGEKDDQHKKGKK